MVRKIKEAIQYKEGQISTFASLQEIVCSLQSDLNNSLNTNVEAQLACIKKNFEAGIEQYCYIAEKTCNGVELTLHCPHAAPENDQGCSPCEGEGPFCNWPCKTKKKFCVNVIYECASTSEIDVDVHEVYCAYLYSLKECFPNALDWSSDVDCCNARADVAQSLEGLLQLLGTYRSIVESSKCILRTVECDLIGYLNSCKRPVAVDCRDCTLNFDFPPCPKKSVCPKKC